MEQRENKRFSRLRLFGDKRVQPRLEQQILWDISDEPRAYPDILPMRPTNLKALRGIKTWPD